MVEARHSRSRSTDGVPQRHQRQSGRLGEECRERRFPRHLCRGAAFGEIVFNCTNGNASLDALKAAGAANLSGKITIDVSNPLDLSQGFPPSIAFRGQDSTGEQIQRAFPDATVVKALGTVNCQIMVDPSRMKGDHDVFVNGNDADAKARVSEILRDWFGWKSIVDLGDITRSRGIESYIVMWVYLYGALGTSDFNIKVER